MAAVLNGGAEMGNPRPGMVVHAVGDRYVAFQIVGSPALWGRLLEVMQRPDLAQDPRFATGEGRRANWRELEKILHAWLDTFPAAEAALEALGKARVPCAPVLRPAEVIAEPHLAERAFFPAVPHPARGTVRVTASPYHLDRAPVHPRAGAPYRVGEHTRPVLRELLGYPADRIAALVRAGAVEAVGD
jgi:crotonobetainyl-CoA:carnitine CoA-transferase CaiB-like acyl-CoA transferase